MFYYMLDIMYMFYHMLMHYTCILILFFINYLLLLSKTFAISLKVIMSYGLTHFLKKKQKKKHEQTKNNILILKSFTYPGHNFNLFYVFYCNNL